MVDRPILFSSPMIRAILEGRKTMTRRVLKPSKRRAGDTYIMWPVYTAGRTAIGRWHSPDRASRYFAGDRMWVRETYCIGYMYDDHDKPISDEPRVFYAATECPRWYDTDTDTWLDSPRWKPSIFMTRTASRLTLIVEAVRVERLQDISEEDAIAEGTPNSPRSAINLSTMRYSPGFRYKDGSFSNFPGAYKRAFAELWDTINGPGSWDANPWVAAITFRPIFANIDSPEARP